MQDNFSLAASKSQTLEVDVGERKKVVTHMLDHFFKWFLTFVRFHSLYNMSV